MIEIYYRIVGMIIVTYFLNNKYLKHNSNIIKILGLIMPIIIILNILLMTYNIIEIHIIFITPPMIIHFIFLGFVDRNNKKKKQNNDL